MERVIYDRLTLRTTVVIIYRNLHCHALELAREGDNGSGSAIGGGNGASVEIVSADRTVAGGLVKVTMAINATGHDQIATSVNNFLTGWQVLANGLNLAICNTDIGLKGVGGRDYSAMANNGVKFGH